MEKHEIIKWAIENAKKYKNNLENKNIMFIYENKKTKKLEYIETSYKPYNYLHLTGLEYKIKSNETKYQKAVEFYKLATIGKLNIRNITIKKREIVELKMKAMNTLMNIDKSAKMIGNYNNNIKDTLYTEKISGTVHYCLGFVKSRKEKYYIPNTALSQNILDITDVANKIIAILKKPEIKEKYSEVTYLAKETSIQKILENSEISNKININF